MSAEKNLGMAVSQGLQLSIPDKLPQSGLTASFLMNWSL